MTVAMFIVYISICAFGWGMWTQEMLQKRARVKARERRIIIDAPFSPEQSDAIMRALEELNEAVQKSSKEAQP